MEVGTQLAKEALQVNRYSEHYDIVLERILLEMGIEKRSKLTKREYNYMKKFLDGKINHKEFEKIIERFGEKEICRNCFNSHWGEFDSYRKELKSIYEDERIAEREGNLHPVSEEIGKQMTDSTTGTHIRTHSTHFDNNLGDLAGFVALGNRGYVAKLFKQGYIRHVTSDGAKQLVFDTTHEIISEKEAKVIADILNRERMIIEADMIQNVNGDSKTTKQAISIITNAGKKKNWNYVKTNELGSEVRRECSKYDNEFGKLLGYSKTEEIPKEKKERKVSRFLFNLMQSCNVNVDDCISTISKMNKKKRV